MVSGIPNIINDLSTDLKARVEQVILLTEQLDETQTKLDLAKRDLKRVQIALEALSGNEIPLPAATETGADVRPHGAGSSPAAPAPVPIPAPVQVPVPSGPTCDACGGELIYTSRRLNNGKQVTLWACRECRNERF